MSCYWLERLAYGLQPLVCLHLSGGHLTETLSKYSSYSRCTSLTFPYPIHQSIDVGGRVVLEFRWQQGIR